MTDVMKWVADVAPWCIGFLIFLGLAWLILQVIGAFAEKAPAFMKVIKTWKQNRKAKKQSAQDQKKILSQVKQLLEADKETLCANKELLNADRTLLESVQATLTSFNEHYKADNIAKRDAWMKEVNDAVKIVETRTAIYDENAELTYKLLRSSYRHQILEFQRWLSAHPDVKVSADQYNNIRAINEDYHEILLKHNDTNGQVDNAWKFIEADELRRMQEGLFVINN